MKDNFSSRSEDYAKYRPRYPAKLYEFILQHVAERGVAWDCGTGNGQTARELAHHFQTVWATDISQQQIAQAFPARNIIYSLQSAEETDFPSHSIDLVTVSQALHWFKFESFFQEVKRVTKPGGWIAAWMYSLLRISPEIDPLINQEFYVDTVGPFWDAERKHVNAHYRSIPFPFREIACPNFIMEYQWAIDDLSGYLRTWSAYKKFIDAGNADPVGPLMQKIAPLWQGNKMNVTFPLFLRMGQIF